MQASVRADAETSKEAAGISTTPTLPAGPSAATGSPGRAEEGDGDVVQVGMKRALEQGDESLRAPISIQDTGAGIAEQERQRNEQGRGSHQKQDGEEPTKKKKRKKNNKPLESSVS